MGHRSFRTFHLVVLVLLSMTLAGGSSLAESNCGDFAKRWAAETAEGISVPLQLLRCRNEMITLRLSPPGVDPIDVELATNPGPAFRKVDDIRLSPILEVDDFSELPEGRRKAFESLVAWLEANPDERLFRGREELVWVVRARNPLSPAWVTGYALLAAFVSILLVAGGILRIRRADGESTAAAGQIPRSSLLIWSGVTFLGAMVAGSLYLLQEPPVHVDTVRDLLLAGEFREGGHRGLGPPSSTGLHHGFVWHYVLAGWQATGLGLVWLLFGLWTSLSVVVAVLSVVLRQRFEPQTALLVLGLYLALVLRGQPFQPLWNPTLVPHFAVLITTCLLLVPSRGRGSWWAVFPGILIFAVATQVHLQFFLLAPAVMYVCFRSPGRWFALALVPTATFLSWAMLSNGSLWVNFELLRSGDWGRSFVGSGFRETLGPVETWGWALLLLLILGVHELASRSMKSSISLSSRALQLALGGYLILYLPLLFLHAHSLRYFAPLLPVTAVLLGEVFGHLSSRLPRWLGYFSVAATLSWLITLAVKPLMPEEDRGLLTSSELAAVVNHLQSRGLSAPTAYERVSPTPELFQGFMSGVWLHARCDSRGQPIRSGGSSERFLLLAPEIEVLPELDAASVLYHRIPTPNRDLIVVPYQPYVHTDTFRYCPEDSSADCRPATIRLSNESDGRCLRSEWAHASLDLLREHPPPSSLAFELVLPANGEPRVVVFPPLRFHGEALCGGRVVRVEGVRHESVFDGRGVKLTPGAAGARGVLHVRWPWENPGCLEALFSFPLPILEFDLRLQALVCARGQCSWVPGFE